MKMLSMKRPRPSIGITTPAVTSLLVKASAVKVEPWTPFCLSSGDSRGVDFLAALRDEREDLSGKVTLQGSNGVELGMPLGESASDVVLGPMIGSQATDSDDVQRAIGGAISSTIEPMPDGPSRRPRNRADAAYGCEAGFRAQSFRIVAGRKEKLGSAGMADRIAGDEVRGQFVDDGGDHRVEICDLVMQLEVTAGEGFEADAIGRIHVAIGGKIGSPRGQRTDELHAGETAQLIAQAIRGADDRVVDHLQGDAPRAHRRLPASHQNPQGFDHAVAASRRHSPLASKGGMGRILSVEIVVLATPAAILLVGRRDLENRNPGLLHETEETCAIAAGRLYSDALKLTEGSHPGEHLTIALPGGGEGSRFHDPILFVDDRCDVQVLMGVDASNNATLSFGYSHSQPPALTCTNGFAGAQCADRTVTRPWRSRPSRVTGIGEAKPHRKAFPGGRQVRGKTRPVDQSAGQTAPDALRRQSSPAGPSL